MPIVRPFRGFLYDPAVAGPIESVVAPPYDVIGKDEQARLYERSPYNVIRLDLSRDADRYGSAARLFREWRERGVIARDAAPALYVYAQRYLVRKGEEHERFGFFTRLRLEDFASKKVLPHEKTLASAKQDRLELQRATRANLSSIFGLYAAPGFELRRAASAVVATEPWADFTDGAGVRHRLWRATDPELHAEVARTLAERTVYIADGHHRYETALRYRDEMRAAGATAEAASEYVLAVLVNLDEPGLVVLPTHRMLRKLPLGADALVEKLRALFRVEEHSADGFLAALAPRGEGERRIGVVLAGRAKRLVLVTRDGDQDARLSGSTALRRLDVTLLHGLVLEGPGSVLGLDAHHEAESGNLVYTKDDDEAVGRAASGDFAASFLLNATRVAEVEAVSQAGETMPEKSTYFYPKIATGLLFNTLED